MNEKQLREATIKFSDYLEANGITVRVAMLSCETPDGRYTLTLGTIETVALNLASCIADINGYALKEKK